MDNRNHKMRNKRQPSQQNQLKNMAGQPLNDTSTKSKNKLANDSGFNTEFAEDFGPRHMKNQDFNQKNSVSSQVTKRIIAEALKE